MKSNSLLIFIIVSAIILNSKCTVFGQGQPGNPDYIPNLSPVPPNVYEFLKYGDVPVSEYTGVPDIRIPIFTVVEGDLKIPVELIYHAGGIRVKEEASWVGLGWSLNFGYITQMVNDRDDFGDFEKILPDHCNKPYPSGFTLRYNYLNGNIPNACQTQSGPVEFEYSYPYFTDYEYPINGDWAPLNNPELFNGIGNSAPMINYIDSEPDLFKATFFGHSLDFILEFETGIIKILNSKTYKISKYNLPNNTIGWKIIDPNGNKYYFEQCDVTFLDESWIQVYGGSTGIIDDRIENRIWSITRIETYTNKEIEFTYFQTPEIENLPSWSQTYHNKIKTNDYEMYTSSPGGYWEFKDVIYYGNNSGESLGSHEETFRVINITKQTISYLQSIQFSQGNLEFNISPRIDCSGTYKLDNIKLKRNDDIIKHFVLEYDHFVGHENGGCYGNAGDIYLENFSQEEITHRLKLISFYEVGKPPYILSYNSVNALPKKTSFAVDYWGFYNGMLSNSSLIANPGRFDVGSDNNNNKSADFDYSISATLKRIDYPTGGFTKFYYGLHSFDNYLVPDINNTNNTESHGLGLRVELIEDHSNGSVAKKVEYLYESGKAITPLKIFSDIYNYKRVKQHGGSGSGGSTVWTVYCFNAYYGTSNNYNLPSLFGSGNYVGYGKVSVSEKNNEEYNGKKTFYFTNEADIAANHINELISLPTLKHKNKPHNGLILKEEIYDENNNLIKETINKHHFDISNKYYGMKTCFYGFLAYALWTGGTGTATMYIKEQDLGVFYAIYSGESLLDTTIVTHWYSDDSNSVMKSYTYNSKNLLYTETFLNSKLETISKTYKYPFNFYDPIMDELSSLNRINDVVLIQEKNNSTTFRSIRKSFFQDNENLILPHGVSQAFNGNTIYNTIILYDDYDIKGNLVEYHLPHSYSTTILWGINYSYVVAEIENATFNEVISALNCTYEELQDKSSSELLMIFDDLREDLPSSFITSYTHNPLIGPSNIVDINSFRTRYSFDDLERLISIRNNDYRVMKYINYNYFNPE